MVKMAWERELDSFMFVAPTDPIQVENDKEFILPALQKYRVGTNL